MKVLNLTLKKKWFDMIDSGEKPDEYREITPYWVKQLIDMSWLQELAEQKDENKNVAEDIAYDINTNGHDPNEVIKAYFCDFKKFDQVFARNGYTPKKNPSWLREWKGTSIGEGKPEWGAEPGKKYFVIKLGERINPIAPNSKV
jgi:hypothetical protein